MAAEGARNLARCALLLAAFVVTHAACGQELLLSRSQWPQPATGNAVVRIPALRAALERYEREPGARIVIRHPGGDAGSAWGLEVHDWMVALGVPSEDIVVEPPSGMPDTLVLDVVAPGTSSQ